MKDRRTQPDGDPRRARETLDDREEVRAAAPAPLPAPRYPDPVDDALDDSFPASDPPPWWGR